MTLLQKRDLLLNKEELRTMLIFVRHIQQQTEPYRLSIALAILLFLPLYLQYPS